MFLKSLTLKGFKSFAETTTLDFEPGVTVVVGPNGSGKSNIVDAVAWVLGAQGPRTVRSGKMEDVIFAGSPARAPLGRAEVSLTIDNQAGLLPIDFTEVTITRTLFRSSGESEYAINGVACRLLDVSELLSDTGVGRQQHVIVSQGQIDAVLDARPEDRRLVIEEAAGVLKYRRRREKAQRRLDATEGNVLRLQDLMREVRRQLRPLERQAEATRRHDGLAAELTALKTHLAGREVSGLEARLSTLGATRADLASADRALRSELDRVDSEIVAAENELTARGAEDLSDALVRVEGLRERAHGLSAVLRERARALQLEHRAVTDESVLASLRSEASQLREQLSAAESAAAALVPRAREIEESEAALANDRVAFDDRWSGADAGAISAQRSAGVRGEISARRSAEERAAVEAARVAERRLALESRGLALERDADRLRAELAGGAEVERALVTEVDGLEARRAAAAAASDAASSALRRAEQESNAADAKVEALTRLLGDGDVASLPGALGELRDLIEVDPGWELAVAAALAEGWSAVVMESAPAAVAALDQVRGRSAAHVLPLGLSPVRDVPSPAGCERVRAHVRGATEEMGSLLDRLLFSAFVATMPRAADLAAARPELVFVTPTGDRLAPTGWRAARAPSETIDSARETASRARDAREHAAAEARELTDALRRVDGELERAVHALDGHDGGMAAAAASLERCESELRGVALEDGVLGSHAEEIGVRRGADAARLAELEDELVTLAVEESAVAGRSSEMRSARAALDSRISAITALRTDLEVRIAAIEERRAVLSERLGEIDDRLAGVEESERTTDPQTLDRASRAVAALSALVADRSRAIDALAAELVDTRRRRGERVRGAASRLEGLRAERASAERQLSGVRERAQRAEVEEAEARLRLDTAIETIRRDLETEPSAAVSTPLPELPPGTSPGSRVRELDRELRLLGPVNPLALEEFNSLSERLAFLEGQLNDVRASRRDLAKVIRAIDADIVTVFAAAYGDVADNFSSLFETLFPGGTGRLRLTDPDNMLETGIEVEARPSGKHVRRLSLLSGGERSLAAMAFLFAVFRSRPSPFYLLDEVEAALDDVNLHRFLDLLHEFRDDAQLLVVTHQKRTMEAADCLYGVTMAPGGSSKVLSERVTTPA